MQVWCSTLGHQVVQTAVWPPSRLDHAHPDASVVRRGSLGIVGFLIGQVQRWLVGLWRRGPRPDEAGRPALDQPLDVGRTRRCVVVDMKPPLVGADQG